MADRSCTHHNQTRVVDHNIYTVLVVQHSGYVEGRSKVVSPRKLGNRKSPLLGIFEVALFSSFLRWDMYTDRRSRSMISQSFDLLLASKLLRLVVCTFLMAIPERVSIAVVHQAFYLSFLMNFTSALEV